MPRTTGNVDSFPNGGPPSGAATGDLAATYPAPQVAAVHETGGPTKLTFGSIPDLSLFKRVGATAVGILESVFEHVASKGAASGYAGLDASTRVPQAQLGTGSGGAGLKALFDDQTYKAVTGSPRFALYKVSAVDADADYTTLAAAFAAVTGPGWSIYFTGTLALAATATLPAFPGLLFGEGKGSVLDLGSNGIAALTHATDVRHSFRNFHIKGDGTAGQVGFYSTVADTVTAGSGMHCLDVTSFRLKTWQKDNSVQAYMSSVDCFCGLNDDGYYVDGQGNYLFDNCIGWGNSSGSSPGGFTGTSPGPNRVLMVNCIMALGKASIVANFNFTNCDLDGDGGGFTQDPASAGYFGSSIVGCKFYASGAQIWTFNGANFRLADSYFNQVNTINLNGDDSLIEGIDARTNGTIVLVSGARCRIIGSKLRPFAATRAIDVLASATDIKVLGCTLLNTSAEDIRTASTGGVYDDNIFSNAVPIREITTANANQLWGTNLAGSVLIGANTLVNNQNSKLSVFADSPVTVSGSFDRTRRADATAGAITFNLPTAASSQFGVLTFKKTDASANTVTIDASGAETIDGALTYVLTIQYEWVTIQSNGTSWDVIG